ncbi:MAG: hypothetical protein ACTSQA_03460 [Candidatus Heimdallarchaeaceae archaeon]|jgi:hypothetical protein
MLSLASCKHILEAKGRSYSKDEIVAIRDLLYQYAELVLESNKSNAKQT